MALFFFVTVPDRFATIIIYNSACVGAKNGGFCIVPFSPFAPDLWALVCDYLTKMRKIQKNRKNN